MTLPSTEVSNVSGVDLDLRHVAVEYHVGFSELAHTVDGIDDALEAKLLFRISEQ